MLAYLAQATDGGVLGLQELVDLDHRCRAQDCRPVSINCAIRLLRARTDNTRNTVNGKHRQIPQHNNVVSEP